MQQICEVCLFVFFRNLETMSMSVVLRWISYFAQCLRAEVKGTKGRAKTLKLSEVQLIRLRATFHTLPLFNLRA